MNKKFSLRERILKGEVVYGIFGKINHPSVAEMAGNAGFDFIIFDTEHGNFSHADVEGLIRAADSAGMSSVVRTKHASAEDVLHALDSGADGVQIPSITDLDTARQVCNSTKYYPQGNRGLSTNQRAAGYGVWKNEMGYYDYANKESLVVVHVENLEMAAKIDELCNLPQIDIIFIGPGDLSQSLGKPGQLDDPEVCALIGNIFERVLAGGKKIGIYCGSMQAVCKYRTMGASYLAVGADVTCLSKALQNLWNNIT